MCWDILGIYLLWFVMILSYLVFLSFRKVSYLLYVAPYYIMGCILHVRIKGITNLLPFLSILSWYQEPTWQKRSRVRISSTPHLSVEYLAPGMRGICVASTLQAQRALAWGGVIEYKSIPRASTISLSFWLSWSFDSFTL